MTAEHVERAGRALGRCCPATSRDRDDLPASRRARGAASWAAWTSWSTTPATSGPATSGLADIEPEQLDRVLKTNLYALFWLTQAALPHLDAGSSIINTTSIQAYEPSTAAARLRRHQVRHQQLHRQPRRRARTARHPRQRRRAGTDLDAAAAGHPGRARRSRTSARDTPLGRAGQPAEVAPAFVFLASPSDASYVSGTVLGVTGGKPVF